VAVAAVVLLCQATAWVHAAATPHVTCLEHGESVHLNLAAPATVAGRPASPRGGLTVAPAPFEPEAHAHEHCGLQGQRTTSSTAPVVDVATASFAPASLPAVARTTPALQLLRLAPKTSPPAAPTV
jgi:hypothetical protein